MQNVYKLADLSLRPTRSASAAPRADAAADTLLLSYIASGDKDAMAILFKRHHVRIYRFVARIVKDQCDAEEIVSEVFFQVWRHAGSFRAESQVSTWLLAIARNLALSALRQRPEDALDDAVALTLVDPADGPERAAQARDRRKLLQLCLRRLPPGERAVIDLVYYHQQTITETSQICGAPEGTIKSRLFAARKRLAALLRDAGVQSSYAC